MRPEISDFLNEYIRRFKALNSNVDSLILFGSQARGTATIVSDIDIAVVTSGTLHPRTRGELMCLADEMDCQFDVNLFFTTRDNIENASEFFDTNSHIKKEGVILWQS